MKGLSITPQLVITVVGWIVSQAVAFGVLTSGVSQTIVAIGGIVIPAAFSIAAALHLGRVHAAKVTAEAAVTSANVHAKPTALKARAR